MPITLTDVIAPNATLHVTSAGLPTGTGGVALRFALYDGPIAFARTDPQARWLIDEIQTQLDHPAWR